MWKSIVTGSYLPASESIEENKWGSSSRLSIWECVLIVFFTLSLSMGTVGMFWFRK